jgi:hypothetical protein
MAMTKKHFEMIAATLRDELANANSIIQTGPKAEAETEGRTAALRNVADALCVKFKHENPLFDRDRFMKACGFSD